MSWPKNCKELFRVGTTTKSNHKRNLAGVSASHVLNGHMPSIMCCSHICDFTGVSKMPSRKPANSHWPVETLCTIVLECSYNLA